MKDQCSAGHWCFSRWKPQNLLVDTSGEGSSHAVGGDISGSVGLGWSPETPVGKRGCSFCSSSREEAESDHLGEDCSISLAEAADLVEKLLGNKLFSVSDGIHPEMPKALDIVGCLV